MTSAASQPAPLDDPKGLGGWLVVWVAWLFVTVGFLGLSGFVLTTFGTGLLSIDDEISFSRSTHVSFGLLGAGALVATALGVLVLVLHFRQSRRARLAHCLWLVALGLFQIHVLFSPLGTRAPVPPLLIMAASIAGLVYFLRSRRVRNTFVR